MLLADASRSHPQRPGCRPGHAAAGLPLLGRPGSLHGRQEAGDSGGRRRPPLPAAARAGASLTAGRHAAMTNQTTAVASHWLIPFKEDQLEFLTGTSLAAEIRAESSVMAISQT